MMMMMMMKLFSILAGLCSGSLAGQLQNVMIFVGNPQSRVNYTYLEETLENRKSCAMMCYTDDRCAGFSVKQSSSQSVCQFSEISLSLAMAVKMVADDAEYIFFQKNPAKHYKNCAEIKENLLEAQSGEYPVQLDDTVDSQIRVYCDMETLGGGWTVFQRRINGEQSFAKPWEQYKQGFGNLSTEFWLGNLNLHKLTNQGEANDLLIELKEWEQSCLLDARFANFTVESETSNFTMTVGQFIGGLAGNCLKTSSPNWIADGMQFSTYDNDNDRNTKGNCAGGTAGGWWLNLCSASNLNGPYRWNNCGLYPYGVMYFSASAGIYYSFQGAEIKLRKSSYRRTNNHTNWCGKKQTSCSCNSAGHVC